MTVCLVQLLHKMRSKFFHLLRTACLFAGIASLPLTAGNFAPPAEGPVAFRRDRISLDVESMARLSSALVTLASGLDGNSAVTRRAAAQMLALATALDPGNLKARALISEMQAGPHALLTDAEALATSRALAWHYLAWLETPEAGPAGQALAACMADVLVISDPTHPRAETLRGAAERGAWAGWVPAVAAYEAADLAIAQKKTEAPAPQALAAGPVILLSKAQVLAPLWHADRTVVPMKWRLKLAPLDMAANTPPPADGVTSAPFSLTVGAPDSSAEALMALLTKQHGTLPVNTRITVGSSLLPAALRSREPQSISAAVAVLANAALTGREPDAIIIGDVDKDGAFTVPGGFWEQLQSLGKGNGGRLVLPAGAAEYLPLMLAMEKPEFFFDYEVLLAADFDHLVALSEKTPGAAIAASTAKFQEIRNKLGSQQMGPYLANSFVRRRLAELAQEATSYHFSAKMLAIQGSGSRPTTIPRPIMITEIRRAIEPMEQLCKRDFLSEDDIAELDTTFETCKGQLDRLLRYAEKDDRSLISAVQKMLAGIRTLDRAGRSRGDLYNGSFVFQSALASLKRDHAAIVADLARAAGEPEPVPEK